MAIGTKWERLLNMNLVRNVVRGVEIAVVITLLGIATVGAIASLVIIANLVVHFAGAALNSLMGLI